MPLYSQLIARFENFHIISSGSMQFCKSQLLQICRCTFLQYLLFLKFCIFAINVLALLLVLHALVAFPGPGPGNVHYQVLRACSQGLVGTGICVVSISAIDSLLD